MTSNEKSLNYKVIDIIESYNFINFTFIRINKKVTIFLKRTEPYHRVVRRLEVLQKLFTSPPRGGWNIVAPPTAVCYSAWTQTPCAMRIVV
jgi:hypothetical protein